MKDQNEQEVAFNLAVVLCAAAGTAFFFGAILVLFFAKKRAARLAAIPISKVLITSALLLAFGFLIAALSKHFRDLHPNIRFTGIFGLWLISGGFAFGSMPLWIKHFIKTNITVADLDDPPQPVDLKDQLGAQGKSIIGLSLKSRTEVFLTENDRVMHTLISGSTGSGKTTLLKSLYADACKKRQPVIIIDPKGNNKTVEEFRQIAIALGVPPEKFKLFSIINPEASSRYNPLARGTSMQIRDRTMGSLTWSESFYQLQASTWLGGAIEILKALNIEVTVHVLHKMLVDRKYLDELEKIITTLPDKDRGKNLLERLRINAKASAQNLDGLIAQLKDLDNLEFGHLLNPNDPATTIELSNVIANSEIVYFQLNVMAYEISASVIGKLILQDLKSLASQIHGEVINVKTDFLPIFVDEFGSFAIEGFIDFLKMCRDVRFANHLFFQSLADLDAVSPEFKAQVQANCKTKIVLRSDDPADSDYWSSVAGTEDVIEQSHQVESFGPFTMRTGAGNARNSKQMKVEHDVFKQLAIGQSVILQKAPAKEDLVNLWLPNPNSIIKKSA